MGRNLLACFGKGGGRRSADNFHDRNATADLTAEEQKRGGPVLVELFSSQGCATSPKAELVVSRLGRGDFNLEVPVVLLAFHVDYWDYMGWKDPYGSSQWTVRQKAYVEALGLDTMFTPQVVVQGKVQCLGTDENPLISAITEAPRFPAPTFEVSFDLSLLPLFFIFILLESKLGLCLLCFISKIAIVLRWIILMKAKEGVL